MEQPPPVRGLACIVQGSPFCPTSHIPLPRPETPPPGQHQGDPQARPFRICCFRFLPALRPCDPGKPQGQSLCGSLRVSMDTHHLHVSGGPPDVLEGRQPPEPAPPRVQLLGLWLQRLRQNLPSEATAGTGCGGTEPLAHPPRSASCPPAGRGSSPASGARPPGTGRLPCPLLLDLLCFKPSGSRETLHTADLHAAPPEGGGVCFQREHTVLIIPQRGTEHGLGGDVGGSA